MNKLINRWKWVTVEFAYWEKYRDPNFKSLFRGESLFYERSEVRYGPTVTLLLLWEEFRRSKWSESHFSHTSSEVQDGEDLRIYRCFYRLLFRSILTWNPSLFDRYWHDILRCCLKGFLSARWDHNCFHEDNLYP